MQPRLVGEGPGPHVGQTPRRHAIGDLPHRARDGAQLRQAAGALGPVPGQGAPPGLELEICDEGEDIGVAGALPEAVDAALDLPGPGPDGSQGPGHGQSGVVVGMDANDAPGVANLVEIIFYFFNADT